MYISLINQVTLYIYNANVAVVVVVVRTTWQQIYDMHVSQKKVSILLYYDYGGISYYLNNLKKNKARLFLPPSIKWLVMVPIMVVAGWYI